jgi:hypothetical protein
VTPEIEADIVVVGAGPAGWPRRSRRRAGWEEGGARRTLPVDPRARASARRRRARRGAARSGARGAAPGDAAASRLRGMRSRGVGMHVETRVRRGVAGAHVADRRAEGARLLHWRQLVLATGARERLLPFPGWTLRGVFGAAGCRRSSRGGWPISGRRVLVAWHGPLCWRPRRRCGAKARTWRARRRGAGGRLLLRFSACCCGHPRKALEALPPGERARGRAPFRSGCASSRPRATGGWSA